MGCLGIFKVGALAENPIERVWCPPNKGRKPEGPTYIVWGIHQLVVKLPLQLINGLSHFARTAFLSIHFG